MCELNSDSVLRLAFKRPHFLGLIVPNNSQLFVKATKKSLFFPKDMIYVRLDFLHILQNVLQQIGCRNRYENPTVSHEVRLLSNLQRCKMVPIFFCISILSFLIKYFSYVNA